ncbi:MAG: ABC transporter permease [Lachnospiraceae bacterium]|jgi:ABC-2 type transport system permease protein|nr:ABC transporter permease [Lachnospiraceae bacterium]
MGTSFKKYYPVLQQFVARDFKTKYRRSILGVFWSVLNPLGTMIVMSIVFSTVFRQSIANFPVYLMCGQLIFSFFSEASTSAMYSIINNGSLIQKVYIPKYLLPMSSVCTSLVNLLTSFIALVIVIIFTRCPITPYALLSFVPIIYTWLFAFGMGLILCVAATSFRDMIHLYSVVTVAWGYLTPIFYPMDMLPPNIQFLVKLNPLTEMVILMRDSILYGQVSSLNKHLYCIACCTVVLVIGIILFKKKQDEFIMKL